jgi:hypothetical protein
MRVEGTGGSQEIFLAAGEGMVFLVVVGEPKRVQIVAQRPKSYLAALLHTGGHWLVLAPSGGSDHLTIDGMEVPALKILDDGSVLGAGGFELRLAERVEEVLVAGSPLIRQAKSCPYCLRPFAEGDPVIYCPTCGLAHHATCLRLGRKCGSFPFCGYTLPAEDGQEKAIRRTT